MDGEDVAPSGVEMGQGGHDTGPDKRPAVVVGRLSLNVSNLTAPKNKLQTYVEFDLVSAP
jgi:hypothetical protein